MNIFCVNAQPSGASVDAAGVGSILTYIIEGASLYWSERLVELELECSIDSFCGFGGWSINNKLGIVESNIFDPETWEAERASDSEKEEKGKTSKKEILRE